VKRKDWSRIAHGGLDFMGPYDGGHLQRLFRGVRLPERARVVDLGCGTGALLAWLAARGPIDGLGVDLRPPRRRIPGVRFHAGDAAEVIGGGCDLACSVGAVSEPWELAGLARWGGLVLYGNGYWRRPPSRRYLKALGAEPDDMTGWRQMRGQGDSMGLELVAAVRSSCADWDRYEDAWAANGERYAADHAGEPGVDEFLDWIRNGRRRYRELGGRDTLGFGLLLWRVAP